MELQLSNDDIKELRRIQKKDRFHRRRFVKATVLLMINRGLSYEDIKDSLSLNESTISRYVKGFRSKGLKAYLEDGYLPYTGRLSAEQLTLLSNHLDDYLYEEAEAVCRYVKATFGIAYTISGMTDLLHRLGFVYKQTKAVPSKADEQAQLEFLQQTLPEVIEEAKKGEAVVYFADGAHPTHNTKTGKGWIRKGKDFAIDCNSGRKRVNINAAVNALKPEHLVYDIGPTINAQSTQNLCRQLLKKHQRKKLYFICDNARYNKNGMLKEWAKKQRVEFIYLPGYSPNLNLIERLWRLLRKKVINSTYYDTFDKFKKGISNFLENIKSYKPALRTLLTLNFRTVDGTSVYLQTTS